METLTLTEAQQAKVAATVAQCALFRALKADQIPQLLKVAEVVRFSPNEPIIKKGDPSDSFFVIVEGEAAIRITNAAGEDQEVGRVPLPASVGEIGLLLGEPRTATVAAVEPVTAVKFGARAFDAMFQKIPDFGSGLSRGLAHRLKQVSSKVPLTEWDSRRPKPTQDVLSMLPYDLCQRHRVLPMAVDGHLLTLGVLDEPSTTILAAARAHVPSMDLSIVHIEPGLYDELMRSHGGVKGWTEDAKPATSKVADVAPLTTIPRLDALLQRMVAEGASDLHLSAGHRPHWRINGDMHEISDAPVLGYEEVLELLTPAMQPRHRHEFAEGNDTDLAYAMADGNRFRVNVFRDSHGVGAVMRLIPSKILSAEQLGLPDILRQFCEIPKGLVLVTGPTGSGKSTTLAAMIDYINKKKKGHIITLEDPIEFVHQSQASIVNQREVGGHTKSFGRALKACLREDPNVVLVGEMRDLETIALALETANTGHLVFATLHTNNAVSAVDRIVDQFPSGQQEQIRSVLADVLRGVVAQTLVKKIGGGRLAVLEILVVNLAIANLIRESKTVQVPSMMQTAKGQGMQTFNDELGKLVEAKKIELDEAVAKAIDKDGLLWRFRSGVTLAIDPAGDRFRVMNVTPDSPGALADLHRGDVIVEIAQKPAAEYSLDDARMLFRTDGKHQLTVERTGKRLRIVMELKR
jgi:twitching motility protein PilT